MKSKVSNLTLLCLARYIDGSDGVYRVVRFTDNDGMKKIVLVPINAYISATELRKFLVPKGYPDPGSIDHWKTVLATVSAQTPKRALLVRMPGFSNAMYILKNGLVFPPTCRSKIFLDPSVPRQFFAPDPVGELDPWKSMSGDAMQGSSRITLGVCSSLSSPLLQFAGIQSGGFHLHGNSSTGKTTALRIANSVMYDPSGLVSWSVTETAVEELASSRNDSLLCFDELGSFGEDPKTSARKLRKVIFKISDGMSKSRSGKYDPQRLRWTVSILSSGEDSLSQYAKDGGTERYRGEEVRVIDVPADAGHGLGICEKLPSQFATTSEFRNHVMSVIEQNHGVAFHHFLSAIVPMIQQDPAAFRERLKNLMAEFKEKAQAAKYDGSMLRVIDRFAVAYAAGMLAIETGTLSCTASTIYQGVQRCMKAALDVSIKSRSKAISDGVAALRASLNSMVLVDRDVKDPGFSKALDLADGFWVTKDGEEYIVLKPAAVRRVLPDDETRRLVCDDMATRKRMRSDKRGNPTIPTEIGLASKKRKRMHWVKRPLKFTREMTSPR